VVLIHGMGACHEHWEKLCGELDVNRYTAYAVDLLGFGDSDKPMPLLEAEGPRGHLYSYDTWSTQIHDFVEQVCCHWA
jgi:alpha-beta hydrolase superfamily lysophospholipase